MGYVLWLHYFLPYFSFREPMSESDRLIKEIEEMEANTTQIESALTGKIQEIQDLDSELTELLKDTNPDEEFKAKLLEIQNNQTKLIQSFDGLQTKLDDYNKMKQDVASTAIRIQRFVHKYILIKYERCKLAI